MESHTAFPITATERGKTMNFTLFFQNRDGKTDYMFNFVDGKMNWAAFEGGKKESDPDCMAELLHDAEKSGLTAQIAVAPGS